MRGIAKTAYLLLSLFFTLECVCCEEFTFELPDKERMCFSEIIEENVKCKLEFQVIEGGNYDVDVLVKSPKGLNVYDQAKQQYDNVQWTTDTAGEYTVCFSNEFSTFTHKVVYFDLQVGDDESFPMESPSAMTQLETSIMAVHRTLRQTIDYQTHHRLREAQGRSFAELLNERVQYWSIGQTVVIIIASVGQLFILKSFFTQKHGSSGVRT